MFWDLFLHIALFSALTDFFADLYLYLTVDLNLFFAFMNWPYMVGSLGNF